MDGVTRSLTPIGECWASRLTCRETSATTRGYERREEGAVAAGQTLTSPGPSAYLDAAMARSFTLCLNLIPARLT